MKSRALVLAPDLKLPLDAQTQTFAILAKRGVGKTYTGAVLVEEMLKAGLHVVIADPVGVWWGLRSSADGKKEGLPITILGGEHGDAPLEETSGSLVADLVIDERISLVMDLGLLRKGQQVRFMQDFCERLYHRNRQALHLLLDEADAFAPQRPMPNQLRMLGAVDDLVRRGRARGIGVTLITQRAAVLNKDVLTQAEVLVALRTIAPQDRKSVDAWVEAHGTPKQREELMGSLPSLPIGTAWFWSPGWLNGLFRKVAIRRRETFDSSNTPKAGDAKKSPRRLAPVDLTRLREKMAATIEKAKADDPRELRATIARLTAALKVAQEVRPAAAVPGKTVVREVRVPILSKANEKALLRGCKAVERFSEIALETGRWIGPMRGAVESIQAILKEVRQGVKKEEPGFSPSPAYGIPGPYDRKLPPEKKADPVPAGDGTDRALLAGERRMLDAIRITEPIKPTRLQVCLLATISPSGGSAKTYWGNLRRGGWIEENTGGRVALAKHTTWTPTVSIALSEVLAAWKAKPEFLAGPRRMLDVLAEQPGKEFTREELGEKSGVSASGGSFKTYIGALKRTGLIDVEKGTIRLSAALMEVAS